MEFLIDFYFGSFEYFRLHCLKGFEVVWEKKNPKLVLYVNFQLEKEYKIVTVLFVDVL